MGLEPAAAEAEAQSAGLKLSKVFLWEDKHFIVKGLQKSHRPDCVWQTGEWWTPAMSITSWRPSSCVQTLETSTVGRDLLSPPLSAVYSLLPAGGLIEISDSAKRQTMPWDEDAPRVSLLHDCLRFNLLRRGRRSHFSNAALARFKHTHRVLF